MSGLVFRFLKAFLYNWQSPIMGSENTLHGKTALVTGASAGIGSETVHALAKKGANIVLAARRKIA